MNNVEGMGNTGAGEVEKSIEGTVQRIMGTMVFEALKSIVEDTTGGKGTRAEASVENSEANSVETKVANNGCDCDNCNHRELCEALNSGRVQSKVIEIASEDEPFKEVIKMLKELMPSSISKPEFETLGKLNTAATEKLDFMERKVSELAELKTEANLLQQRISNAEKVLARHRDNLWKGIIADSNLDEDAFITFRINRKEKTVEGLRKDMEKQKEHIMKSAANEATPKTENVE